MSQTTIQHPETIRFGSAKVEIGADADNLVDIGAANNVVFTHDLGTKNTIRSDNAGVVLERVSGQTATVSLDLLEINLDILAMYLDGISILDVQTGDAVSVTGESHVLSGETYVRLANKNANGTEVTGISVQNGAGDPATLGTDYTIQVDSQGYTAIARVADSTVIVDNGTAVVDYSYTPAASKKLSVGGLQRLNAYMVKLTNYNEADEELSITVYKGTANTGIVINFLADDADDVNSTPIEIQGTEDTARAKGDQLFVIVDEQTTEYTQPE